MSEFLSFNIGDAGIMSLLAVMWWRLGSVERKIEGLQSKETAEAETLGLRREINGLARRLDTDAH